MVQHIIDFSWKSWWIIFSKHRCAEVSIFDHICKLAVLTLEHCFLPNVYYFVWEGHQIIRFGAIKNRDSKTVHYWHTTAMKRHMKRTTEGTRCVLSDNVWAGNGCFYTLTQDCIRDGNIGVCNVKTIFPLKLTTDCHSTSSLIQFQFMLNSTAFQWQQSVLEMRHAKVPMQDHTES
jgi:hypothetical protein